MSDLLQSGHHPDADQLNAFVEHTLPRHEQEQTLAHLAICPDCRSIVTLSLPPVDEVPGWDRERVRKSWFLSWRFAWPVAAALAGLVLFLIYIRSVAIHKGNAGTTELAVAPSPPHLPNATAPTSAPPGAQPPVSSTQPDRHTRATVRAPQFADQAKTEAAAENQSIAGLSLQDRNVAGLKRLQPKSPIALAPKPMQSSNGTTAANSVASGAVAPQVSVSSAKDFLQKNGSGSGLGNLRDQPAAAGPAASPVTALNQTAAVRAAPVVTLSALSNNSISDQAKGILPSGFAALSQVSAGHQVLAIDTHNVLFFSDDNGIHWKAIPSPWQGRAVKVSMASTADVSGERLSTNINIGYAPSGVTANGGPVLSPSAKSTLGGTVTDVTGAAIADASVVISNATASNIRTVKTDRDGTYVVDGLVPGSYRVEAHAPGFSAQQLAITLAPAQQSLANIALSVGQATETVTVDAAAISLEAPIPAKKKAAEPSLPSLQFPPRFEITIDTGEHWTSSDGQTWKRK